MVSAHWDAGCAYYGLLLHLLHLTTLFCSQDKCTYYVQVPWTLERLSWPAVLGSGRLALKLSKYGGLQTVLKSVLSQLCCKQSSDTP